MEKLQEIFRDIFDDEDLVICDTTSAKDIEDWDSLTQINLIVAIEEEFKIKFKLEEVAKLNNVGEMLQLINQKVSEK